MLAFWLVTCAHLFAASQEVQVRLSSDRLQMSAPGLHFLTGKPLEQLRNGASVAFDIQVSVLADSRQTVLHRSFDRFVLSYDVWEEKFSVVRMRSAGGSALHMTAPVAEAWCVSRFSLLTAGLPEDKPLWIRIDVRANEGRERKPETEQRSEDEGFSVASLVDMFSRPPGRPRGLTQWRAESASFQLASLRRLIR
ncbi:MAG: hypothetical protein H7039_08035 [Bryobacteraceae bacterium]|nr:hypothetical protein [Bryobacteraceae bacterium]